MQNKEPDHFLLLFKGKMIVHAGGHVSGFKNRRNLSDNAVSTDIALYHVRGIIKAFTFVLNSIKRNYRARYSSCSSSYKSFFIK